MPLLNSFVDSFVCVGFSSERGLTLDPESKHEGSIFTSSLQPSILGIVTADRAIYPQLRGGELTDPLYPPVDCLNSYSTTISSTNSGHSTPISSSTASIRTTKQSIIPASFTNLPFFCFPDGVQASYQRENEKIHQIVFTQEEGKRSYALALTFQQAFTVKTAEPDDNGVYQIEEVKSSIVKSRSSSISKIPVSIDKQNPTSPSISSSSSSSISRTHSRKMPSSYHYVNTSSTSQTGLNSSDSAPKQEQYHYATHTISSYNKKFVIINRFSGIQLLIYSALVCHQ